MSSVSKPGSVEPMPDHSTVLKAEHLGKEYKLYDSPRKRLRALITGGEHHRSHWALRDVSFELGRGQCMGVVGNNGAGKSSLLKLIAGTLQPSVGKVERHGRITAILELGAGFHPDFTGRDNLYFGASLIGISPTEMRALESSIVEFSELGEAIDRPVKTYSSGMTVRLAFALVTALEPDVLIVDEALAVGDQQFQKKCISRIDAFRKNGCTILFCSHSLYHVRQLCNKVLWLESGQQKAFGDTETVLSQYEADIRAKEALAAASSSEPQPDAAQSATAPTGELAGLPSGAQLISVEVEKLGAGDPPVLESPDLVICMTAQVPPNETPQFGVMLEQLHGVGVTSAGTHYDNVTPTHMGNGLWAVRLRFPNLPLFSGQYTLSAYLFDSQGLVVLDEWLHCIQFHHIFPGSTPGIVRLEHAWE